MLAFIPKASESRLSGCWNAREPSDRVKYHSPETASYGRTRTERSWRAFFGTSNIDVPQSINPRVPSRLAIAILFTRDVRSRFPRKRFVHIYCPVTDATWDCFTLQTLYPPAKRVRVQAGHW